MDKEYVIDRDGAVIEHLREMAENAEKMVDEMEKQTTWLEEISFSLARIADAMERRE